MYKNWMIGKMVVLLRQRQRDRHQESQEENLRGNIKNSLLEILTFSPQAHLNGTPSSIELILICSGENGCWSMGMFCIFLLGSISILLPGHFLSFRRSQAVI